MTAKLVPLRRISGDVTEMSDEALVAACGTGDATSLGALYDRFHNVVYRFAGRLPGIGDAARDDLVQTTFLEVARAAPRFRGKSSVSTWIVGIAANLARTMLRGERRRLAHQARFLDDAPTAPALVDEQVERRRLLARIAAAIGRLSPDEQIAFVLCNLEHHPATEVARALGIPEGTLWRRLHDARKRLRAVLSEGSR